jgi:nucleoside diphosphate kinase
MNIPKDLTTLVADKIRLAQTGLAYDEVILGDTAVPVLKNEYLLFLKPEITMPSETIQLEAVVDLILEQMDAFGIVVHDVRILAASYLEAFNLIDQHYGVISLVSNQGLNAMTEGAKERFKEIYGVEADDSNVLGGMEFLRKYPFFNFHSLDCMWQNSENLKLASGTYVEKLRIDQDEVYLLNAFHPKQLRHFTEPGRSIVLFNISGDRPWKEARESFAGATDPRKAVEGSLRRLLMERKEELGIPDVSQSFNGIHLSAGPVEALIELHRFDSDHSSPEGEADFKDFTFGKELMRVFGEIPEALLNNETIEVDGKSTTIFDLTENLDSDEALQLLKKCLK